MKCFLQFFAETSWKVKKKTNSRRKWCITAWALKSHERFLQFFYWSFMKSQDQIELKKRTLYHSLGIEKPWNISFHQFFAETSWKVKKKINSSRKWCITAWALKSYERFLTVFYRSFMKSQDQIKLEENIVSQLGLPKILGCHASNSQLEIGPKHEDMPSFKSIRGCFNTSAVPQGRLAYL